MAPPSSFKARRRALSGGKVAPNLPKVPPGKALQRPAPPLRGERGEKGNPGPAGAPTSIPPGSYVGQLIAWDGSAYVPRSLVRTWAIQPSPDAVQFGLFGDVDNKDVSVVTSGEFSTVRIGASHQGSNVDIFSTVGQVTLTAKETIALTLFLGAPIARYEILPLGHDEVGEDEEPVFIPNLVSHRFTTASREEPLGQWTNLSMGVSGDDHPTIGFLGVDPPVPRQSITGATTQDQVDSLVAALVALGLATDDR